MNKFWMINISCASCASRALESVTEDHLESKLIRHKIHAFAVCPYSLYILGYGNQVNMNKVVYKCAVSGALNTLNAPSVFVKHSSTLLTSSEDPLFMILKAIFVCPSAAPVRLFVVQRIAGTVDITFQY
jgi:hypothetical protein